MKKKAVIVGCSNGQPGKYREKIDLLGNMLEELGIECSVSSTIYQDENGISATAKQRAQALVDGFGNPEVDIIFDISGGDLANEVLTYLDFEKIEKSKALLFGYSDLTCVLNAVWQKTGKECVLYQVRNLLYKEGKLQGQRLSRSLMEDKEDLYDVSWEFLQGEKMSGIVAGGNIRCLLKLAGTGYWPDMKGKLLLLESFSGNESRIRAYFSQLQQMGIFEQVEGILLGTFTELEEHHETLYVWKLLKEYIPSGISVAYTKQIGHGTDSKAVVLGRKLNVTGKL